MKNVFLGVLLLAMISCSVTFNVGDKKSKATPQPVEIPLDRVAPVGEFVAFDMIDDEQLIYVAETVKNITTIVKDLINSY